MKILIKFPTRGRVANFFRALDRYYAYASDVSRLEVQVTIDEDDKEMYVPEVLEKLKGYPNLSIQPGLSRSKIHAINRDLKDEGWDILLLASDDMIPVVEGYDRIIREKMQQTYPDTDGILWFNDGNRSDLNTLSIMGRQYYKRFNYLYHPGYRSLYCDKEFTLVGDMLGKQTFFDQVIIHHEHPDYGYGDKDTVHDLNKINKDGDLYLFLKRQARNFGIGNPVINTLSGLTWEAKRVVRKLIGPR